MSTFVQNFEIKTFPQSPGPNGEAKPPEEEVVISAPTYLAPEQISSPNPWFVKLVDSGLSQAQILTMLQPAADNHIRNLSLDPWADLVKRAGQPPGTETVQVSAKFGWMSIFSAKFENASGKKSITTTSGVTSTDSETNKFTAQVGASVTGGFGPVSATLSATFTAESDQTHSVALAASTSETVEFDFQANSFVQVWQLYQVLSAGDSSIKNLIKGKYVLLTYPETGKSGKVRVI